MKIRKFKEWLQMKYPDSKTTVSNRIANCNKVEKHYGNLDNHFDTDRCELIIRELTYSIDDERNNIQPLHKIPIDGKKRTGSATLKQAVKLYVQFRTFLVEDILALSEVVQSKGTFEDSENNNIKDQLILLLGNFNFNTNEYEDTTILQIELKDYLSEKLPRFEWEIEYKPSDAHKDSIDIFGSHIKDSLKIIIEIDAHRADQVAKKFTSRTSLFINENVLYVSLCYPPRTTTKINKNECTKYFKYCSDLSDFITKHTKINKQYIGYHL